MRISQMALLLALAALLLAAAAPAQVPLQATEAVQASAAGFELRDGVVVDPNADRIYAMSREGGVESLTLDGQVEWRSEAAARPIGLYGELVIAQPQTSPEGRMELVFLDRSGAAAGDGVVDLAPGVVAQVARTPHADFDAVARIEDGVPVFDWRHTRYQTGALMVPDPGLPGASVAVPAQLAGRAALEAANPQTVGGAIAFDPANGQQTTVAPVPRNVQPFAADDRLIATDYIPGAIQAMRSKDGRHVLVVERVAPGETLEYRWTVFDAQSQARIGSTMSRLGGANFFVRGGTLVYEASPFVENGRETGLRLVAANLGDGQVMWEHEIFDTEYRGPVPN